jgi:flagellar biosynthesis/type III secretory pathway M-ring protein FliF/YscJ
MISLQVAPIDNPLSILDWMREYGVVPVLIVLSIMAAGIIWRQVSWERTEKLKEDNRAAERRYAIEQALIQERARWEAVINSRFEHERQLYQAQIDNLKKQLNAERRECAEEIEKLQKQIDEKQDK